MKIKKESAKGERKVINDVNVGKAGFLGKSQIKCLIFTIDTLRLALEESGYMDDKRWITFMKFSEELKIVYKEIDNIAETLKYL